MVSSQNQRIKTIVDYYNLMSCKEVTQVDEIPRKALDILSSTPIDALQYALAVEYKKTKKRASYRKIKNRFPFVAHLRCRKIANSY